MTFTNYLKEQLTDYVESYRKYGFQTFGTALTYTILCFILSALLLRFSDFDKSSVNKQISLLSYFFYRYSKADTYSIVDLTKGVFIFFVSLFSIGLIRLDKTDNKFVSFNQFVRKIHFKDIIYLVAIFLITSILDYEFFRIDSYSTSQIQNIGLEKYIHNLLFHLRIYIPLILFSLTIRSLLNFDKVKITFKRILFLYISLWLFNEFAFEISLWVRNHLFALLLLPFSDSYNYYLYESIIGIPLIAFYFLGYFSAMTTYFKQSD